MQITSINGFIIVKTSAAEYDAKYGAGTGTSLVRDTGGFFATKYNTRVLGVAKDAGVQVPKFDQELTETLHGSSAIVILKEVYDLLDQDAIEAVAAHEMGHIVLGHTDIIDANGSVGVSTNLQFELEADAFAVQVVGKRRMARALTKVLEAAARVAGFDAGTALMSPGMRARFAALQ